MRVSVVLPTLNEAETIGEVLKRLKLMGVDEIIVVDDGSTDGTIEVVKSFMRKNGIRLYVRKEKGLASAIFFGIEKAKNELVCVMDADLQHLPEQIKEMYQKMKECDICIASRFVEGAKVDMPLHRILMSKLGALLCRLAFGLEVKDPLSGFFMLKKKVIRGVELEGIGFKALLEILVKGKYQKACEIPIIFKKRKKGKSKFGLKIILAFLKQIWKLRKG